MDKYKIIKKIGSGSQGSVYLAKLNDDYKKEKLDLFINDHPNDPTLIEQQKKQLNTKQYAVKAININQQNEIEVVEEEIKLVKNLDTIPHVVRYYDYFTEQVPNFAGEDDIRIYLTMEYCNGGSLEDKIQHYIKRDEQIPIQKIRFWIFQLAYTLDFLHSRSIVHRDLKPCNMLLAEGSSLDQYQNISIDMLAQTIGVKNVNELKEIESIKLIDFGFGKQSKNLMMQTFVGTLHYMSPEVFMGKKYDSSVDIWSLGIIILRFLMFQDEQSLPNIRNEVKQNPDYIPTLLKNCDPILSEITFFCLLFDSTDRPTAKEIVSFFLRFAQVSMGNNFVRYSLRPHRKTLTMTTNTTARNSLLNNGSSSPKDSKSKLSHLEQIDSVKGRTFWKGANFCHETEVAWMHFIEEYLSYLDHKQLPKNVLRGLKIIVCEKNTEIVTLNSFDSASKVAGFPFNETVVAGVERYRTFDEDQANDYSSESDDTDDERETKDNNNTIQNEQNNNDPNQLNSSQALQNIVPDITIEDLSLIENTKTETKETDQSIKKTNKMFLNAEKRYLLMITENDRIFVDPISQESLNVDQHCSPLKILGSERIQDLLDQEIDMDAEDERNIQLERMYLSPEKKKRKNSQDTEYRDQIVKEESKTNDNAVEFIVNKVISTGKHDLKYVILGSTATGKTTLMKMICYNLAKKSLENVLEKNKLETLTENNTDDTKYFSKELEFIPLFVPLSNIVSSNQEDNESSSMTSKSHIKTFNSSSSIMYNMEDEDFQFKLKCIRASADTFNRGLRYPDDIEEYLIHAWSKKKVLLLLDGLDETGEHKSEVEEEICKLNLDFLRGVVITSRVSGFQTETSKRVFESFNLSKILPLSFENQMDIAKKREIKDQAKFEIYLKRYREIARVPLLLSLMIQEFKLNNKLPQVRAELYSTAVDTMLLMYFKKYRQTEEGERRKKNLIDLKEFMCIIAEQLLSEKKRTFRAPFIKKIQNTLKSFQNNKSSKKSMSKRNTIMSSTTLKASTISTIWNEFQTDIDEGHFPLIIKLGNDYLFSHLSFQEFFVASIWSKSCTSSTIRKKKRTNSLKNSIGNIFSKKNVPVSSHKSNFKFSKKTIKKLLVDPWYRETFLLCAGKMEKNDFKEFIKFIFELFKKKHIIDGLILQMIRMERPRTERTEYKTIENSITDKNRVKTIVFNGLIHESDFLREMTIRRISIFESAEIGSIVVFLYKKLSDVIVTRQAASSLCSIFRHLPLNDEQKNEKLFQKLAELLSAEQWKVAKSGAQVLVAATNRGDSYVCALLWKLIQESNTVDFQVRTTHTLSLIANKGDDRVIQKCIEILTNICSSRDTNRTDEFIIKLCEAITNVSEEGNKKTLKHLFALMKSGSRNFFDAVGTLLIDSQIHIVTNEVHSPNKKSKDFEYVLNLSKAGDSFNHDSIIDSRLEIKSKSSVNKSLLGGAVFAIGMISPNGENKSIQKINRIISKCTNFIEKYIPYMSGEMLDKLDNYSDKKIDILYGLILDHVHIIERCVEGLKYCCDRHNQVAISQMSNVVDVILSLRPKDYLESNENDYYGDVLREVDFLELIHRILELYGSILQPLQFQTKKRHKKGLHSTPVENDKRRPSLPLAVYQQNAAKSSNLTSTEKAILQLISLGKSNEKTIVNSVGSTLASIIDYKNEKLLDMIIEELKENLSKTIKESILISTVDICNFIFTKKDLIQICPLKIIKILDILVIFVKSKTDNLTSMVKSEMLKCLGNVLFACINQFTIGYLQSDQIFAANKKEDESDGASHEEIGITDIKEVEVTGEDKIEDEESEVEETRIPKFALSRLRSLKIEVCDLYVKLLEDEYTIHYSKSKMNVWKLRSDVAVTMAKIIYSLFYFENKQSSSLEIDNVLSPSSIEVFPKENPEGKKDSDSFFFHDLSYSDSSFNFSFIDKNPTLNYFSQSIKNINITSTDIHEYSNYQLREYLIEKLVHFLNKAKKAKESEKIKAFLFISKAPKLLGQLSHSDDSRVVGLLSELTNYDSISVKESASAGLGSVASAGNKAVIKVLTNLLEDKSDQVREATADSLSKIANFNQLIFSLKANLSIKARTIIFSHIIDMIRESRRKNIKFTLNPNQTKYLESLSNSKCLEAYFILFENYNV